ncbi:HK97 family phage prohead protease [Sinorhizobium medicae]
MKTETKSLTVEKMDEKGHGLAKIATLSAVDHDGDTYLPGAFSWKEGGQWVPILPAHDRKAMPFGKARVFEDGDGAYAELHMNLDTEAGREWHSALKFDLAKGAAVQEWSYGFGVLDQARETRNGEPLRVLKRLDVHEISTVVRGAGVGTGTLAMKSRGSFADQIETVIAEIDDIVERAGGVKALREAQGRDMSKARREQLTELRRRFDDIFMLDPFPPTTEKAREEAERLAADFLTLSARRNVGL